MHIWSPLPYLLLRSLHRPIDKIQNVPMHKIISRLCRLLKLRHMCRRESGTMREVSLKKPHSIFERRQTGILLWECFFTAYPYDMDGWVTILNVRVLKVRTNFQYQGMSGKHTTSFSISSKSCRTCSRRLEQFIHCQHVCCKRRAGYGNLWAGSLIPTWMGSTKG